MTEPILPPLKPIPMKDRAPVLFVEKGNLDVPNGAFVIVPDYLPWNTSPHERSRVSYVL